MIALAVLVIACNAAMFGLSRLGYSLALNRQIPSMVGRLHPRYNTPVVLIVLGALLAIALVLPTDLEFLAAIYAFGATLAFTARAPRGDPAALPRARARPALQGAVQPRASGGASCR